MSPHDIIIPIDQCISQIPNFGSVVDWIGFDKYEKFIYGVEVNGGKLLLVAQSVFGGNKIILQRVDLDDENHQYRHFNGAVNDETVVVV